MAYSKSVNDITKAKSMTSFLEERELGRGGFGRVYLVKDKATGKWYAIKKINITQIIADQALGDALRKQLEAMIFQEAVVMQQVEHGNIVRLYASFMEAGHFHMVMEYCDGGTLKQAIKKKGAEGEGAFFPEDEICHWISQIATALAWLHDRKVLHRDIKSENIFFMANDSRTLKLGDFGIVRMLEKTSAKTVTGMAPEVLSAKKYDFKSEVWSLGVVAYELATLKLPFSVGDRNVIAIAHAIATAPVTPISEKTYSRELCDLIEKKMLVRNVGQRASMSEICNDQYIKRMKTKSKAEQRAIDDTFSETAKKVAQLEAKFLMSEQRATNFHQRLEQSQQANAEINRKFSGLESRFEEKLKLLLANQQRSLPPSGTVDLEATVFATGDLRLQVKPKK